MVKRKWAALICAIITFVIGLLFDETVIKPIIYGITDGMPCPTNDKWIEPCLNIKKILFVSPYLFTFGGLYRVLRVATGDED